MEPSADLSAHIWSLVAEHMSSSRAWARASGTCRAARDAPLRCIIAQKEPPGEAALRWIARRWDACEAVALALEPLEFRMGARQMLVSTKAHEPRSGPQRARELALCLAAPAHYEAIIWPHAEAVMGLPWVRALLGAPRQLALLSLEVDYALSLPWFAALRHLLLYVRRKASEQVCEAIPSMPTLETLSIAASRVYDERDATPYAQALPPLDLRQNRRLRAAAFTDAVPAALRPPPNDSCRCAIAADAESLYEVWGSDRAAYTACSLYTEERWARASPHLVELLGMPCSALTHLHVTCTHLDAACALPALRELHVKARGCVRLRFSAPLRLSALSIEAATLQELSFDSPAGLAARLGWLHLRFFADHELLASLQPLLDRCAVSNYPPAEWATTAALYSSKLDVAACQGLDLLAYFPRSAKSPEKRRRRCQCGACHRCLRAAGAMSVRPACPALPMMQRVYEAAGSGEDDWD